MLRPSTLVLAPLLVAVPLYGCRPKSAQCDELFQALDTLPGENAPESGSVAMPLVAGAYEDAARRVEQTAFRISSLRLRDERLLHGSKQYQDLFARAAAALRALSAATGKPRLSVRAKAAADLAAVLDEEKSLADEMNQYCRGN